MSSYTPIDINGYKELFCIGNYDTKKVYHVIDPHNTPRISLNEAGIIRMEVYPGIPEYGKIVNCMSISTRSDHPNILNAENIFFSDDSLSNLHIVTRCGDGPLENYDIRTFEDLVDILYDIASGLQFLHSRGYIYRSLDPKHIIMVDEVAKLSNFDNVCKKTMAKTQTSNFEPFKAPEAFFKPYNYNESIDIWAFGCLIYYLVHPERRHAVHDVGITNYNKLAEMLLIGSPMPSLNFSDRYQCSHTYILKELYEKCISNYVSDRPTATEIVDRLSMICRRAPNIGSWRRIPNCVSTASANCAYLPNLSEYCTNPKCYFSDRQKRLMFMKMEFFRRSFSSIHFKLVLRAAIILELLVTIDDPSSIIYKPPESEGTQEELLKVIGLFCKFFEFKL